MHLQRTGVPNETILSENRGRVRILTLNRPEALNAFNGPLLGALANALIEADADPQVGVTVLTGAGRAFSAGADLAQDRSAPSPQHGFPGLIEQARVFSKPLLLAINGLGVGIGATLCGLADLVFIAANARLRCLVSSADGTPAGCLDADEFGVDGCALLQGS